MVSERPVDEEIVGLLESQNSKEELEEYELSSTDSKSNKSYSKQENFLEIE